MRLYIVAALLCLWILESSSSPIGPTTEQTKDVSVTGTEDLKPVGRQSSDDDDDDDEDDDDDDLGLDVGADDDDDEDDDDEGDAADDDDDDDDDDDEDYFERFFDDILGDDDDDDDDEEDDVSPSTGSETVVTHQVAEQPVGQQVSPQEELDAIDEEEIEAQTQDGNSIGDASESAETLIDKDPTDVVQNSVVQQQSDLATAVADDEDADADDDDDDDDDDDEEDDDDDDDDDDDLDDVIEAKRARALGSTKMPAIYISKYNRFVDTIIGRINHILAKSYDPVRVKLPTSGQTKSKNKKNKKKRRTNTKRRGGNKSKVMPANKMGELSIARSNNEEPEETAFVLISKTSDEPAKNLTRMEYRVSTTNKRTKNKSKAKTKKAPKARATLLGLSTIRRDGDVMVNMMTNHTTVKTNFKVGPLTLRVEKEVGRGAKREFKSATATTEEMYGRMNLRIVHGGAATLHSIKVLQPKQVRVDSADNHEKTKEFVWKRSSNIATMVSQKLASATRSMLKPPPLQK